MITHLEPDILECEVKSALGSITPNKASGGDRIPVDLFQILKDDAVKVLHSICQQIWKTEQWPQDWKRSVFIPIPKKGNAKECSDYHTSAPISHTSKVMLKILQARLQQYVHCELPDVQAGFRKGRRTRDQIANIHLIIVKARDFWKNIYFYLIDYAKAFDCVSESEVTQSCLTLCNPMDCSLTGFSVHGIFQAGVLGWVAISSSRGSSQPRDQTWVSHVVVRHFTI